MLKKSLDICVFIICSSCSILYPKFAQSSYCSDVVNKCREKCYEITLDDIMKGECMTACQAELELCYKTRNKIILFRKPIQVINHF